MLPRGAACASCQPPTPPKPPPYTPQTHNFIHCCNFNHLAENAEGDKLHAGGNKLYAEGDKLHAGGDKLHAEGDKLHAEGDLLFSISVLHHYGNVTMDWQPNGDCRLPAQNETFKAGDPL